MQNVIPDPTMQRVVDMLYPEFKKLEEKIKKRLYYERMKELGRDVELIKKEKKEKRKNSNKKDKSIVEKLIMFYLIPAVNLNNGEEPMTNLQNHTFKTSEKKDIKYLKRFLAYRLNDRVEDIDIY